MRPTRTRARSSERRLAASQSHNASNTGSTLLGSSSRTAVPVPEVAVRRRGRARFFVADKPDAVVLDFFAGSGTTAHAVMRLNKQDGGRRQSIMVTNNEVSAEEAAGLRAEGPSARRPRVGGARHLRAHHEAAHRPPRSPARRRTASRSRATTSSPTSSRWPTGFEENVEFFDLTYEDPERVRLGLGFEAIAPLLWLRAGQRGRADRRASRQRSHVADTYAVLSTSTAAADFVAAVRERRRLRIAYIVTDDETQFQVVAAQLPARVEPVRLYEAYLDNFEITAGGARRAVHAQGLPGRSRRASPRTASMTREDDYRRKDRRIAFALSAITGAGKTVMASAVFEALFDGSEEFEVEADPGAVVLWVTDDPNLNEQTRYRIMEASDRLDARG